MFKLLDGSSCFSHFATNVISSVISLSKSNNLLPLYQPINLYPSLKGSAGFLTLPPTSNVDLFLPSLKSNVILFLPIASHFARRTISPLILVSKSNSSSPKYHPANLYPFFIGSRGFIIFPFDVKTNNDLLLSLNVTSYFLLPQLLSNSNIITMITTIENIN